MWLAPKTTASLKLETRGRVGGDRDVDLARDGRALRAPWVVAVSSVHERLLRQNAPTGGGANGGGAVAL